MKHLYALMLLLLSLQGAISASQPTILNAIIAVDTLGQGIQGSTIADLEHIETSLYAIAYHLHLTPKILVLKDQYCCVESIKKSVLSLGGNANDIVIFVYSGHGDMDPYKSTWPLMLPTGRENSPKGLAASSVVKFFQKNHHRLSILLFDCCNKSIQDWPYDAVPRGHMGPILSSDRLPGLKDLFLESKGVVIGAAASHGEYSWGFNRGSHAGGIFLNGFLSSLKKKCIQKNISWNDIFYKIEKYCSTHEKRQHPILRYSTP